MSVREGAVRGLLESLGLREGVQSCLPLILSSKPTVRGEGLGERRSLCFLWSENSSFPSIPK